jgi:2-polyprenyl-3-methyl-5-hydroxy-6-metoxy-1,4-benzoquinol methylase
MNPEHAGVNPLGTGVMHPHGLHRVLHPVWFTPVHRALARAVNAQPGESMLDVGAGSGLLSERVARMGASVISLEPDHDSLNEARQRWLALFVRANR